MKKIIYDNYSVVDVGMVIIYDKNNEKIGRISIDTLLNQIGWFKDIVKCPVCDDELSEHPKISGDDGSKGYIKVCENCHYIEG